MTKYGLPLPSGDAAAEAEAATTTTQFAPVMNMRTGTFQSIPIEIDSPWLRMMILEWAAAAGSGRGSSNGKIGSVRGRTLTDDRPPEF